MRARVVLLLMRPARLVLTLVLAVYGFACLRSPEGGGLMGGVDLAVHETGHMVFLPLGETMHFLGGTLGQLLMPIAFVVYFWRNGDRHAATVPLWWVGQNLWNISVYVADARAQELPLVGGGEHDWAYLLGRAGWLAHDTTIARGVHFMGVLVYIVAIAAGVLWARAEPATPREDPVPPGDARTIR